ncbi:LysR family transcriptional regulator [Rhizorhabdus phycosphaerae]|uniref:LysR family transcriptional regulator n=1 Tax=Rhizorhabdus phycosphaerae TaxID=2711156 RepID=UPI0013ECD58E|nr:LysR family transcriptional regulator [Rhizorhabdus phycosphaerae]
MDIRQLRHSLTVAETLHFGRAAERLGMTQPPLSQSILALERELGASLFLRSRRSVALTPFGRQWLDEVRPAVAAIDGLADAARRLLAGQAGRLSLSFVSTADYSVLPTIVQRYAAAFPDVRISLQEATSDVQIDALLEGQADAGIIIPSLSALPARLSYRPLLHEPLIAAVPEAWVEEERLSIERGRILGHGWMDEPLLLFPARVSPDFHELVMGFYRAQGREPAIRQEAIQMQTIVSLVSAGMGMALVPSSMRHLARTGTRYLELAGPAPMLETGLAWLSANRAPTLLALIEVAAGISGSDGLRRP